MSRPLLAFYADVLGRRDDHDHGFQHRHYQAAASRNATGDGVLFTLQQELEAVGTVTFAGGPGDSLAGWSVGWIQAQWIETNWGTYLGARDADGSIFVQRARPPARPKQACLDQHTPSAPFYGRPGNLPLIPAGSTGPAIGDVAHLTAADTLPATVEVYHYDKPRDEYIFTVLNSLTGADNHLNMVQLEFAFCAILTVRPPVGSPRYLRSFYWNCNWQTSFRNDATSFVTPTEVAGGNTANVGRVFTGPPNDPRFAAVLAHPQTFTCNDAARNAGLNPNVREERRWANFDVRR